MKLRSCFFRLSLSYVMAQFARHTHFSFGIMNIDFIPSSQLLIIFDRKYDRKISLWSILWSIWLYILTFLVFWISTDGHSSSSQQGFNFLNRRKMSVQSNLEFWKGQIRIVHGSYFQNVLNISNLTAYSFDIV